MTLTIKPAILLSNTTTTAICERTPAFFSCLLKRKGKDLYFGPGDILWKVEGRTWSLDADLFTRNNSFGCGQPPSDSLLHIFDNPLELDGITVLTEVGAALIPGIGWKKCTVGGNDFIGEKPQVFSDVHQDVEDVIVQIFP